MQRLTVNGAEVSLTCCSNQIDSQPKPSMIAGQIYSAGCTAGMLTCDMKCLSSQVVSPHGHCQQRLLRNEEWRAWVPESSQMLSQLAGSLPGAQLVFYGHALRCLPAAEPQLAHTQYGSSQRQCPVGVPSPGQRLWPPLITLTGDLKNCTTCTALQQFHEADSILYTCACKGQGRCAKSVCRGG